MGMVISATSLMNRAYAGNVNFKDENYRKNSSNHEKVSADRKAMVRALKKLEQLDFDSKDVDDTKSLYNTVTSYLDIYNNTVSSAMDSDNSNINRIGKQMKAMMKEHAGELEAIGIQIKSNGTVKIDKSKLQKATTRQTEKVFGNSDYISGMNQLMKKLRNQVSREVPKQEGQAYEAAKSGTETDGQANSSKSAALSPETVGSNLNLLV